jgi:hypothetical protein
MVAFRRVLLAAVATLLVAGACTSITVPSIPPINIPTIPPINLPGGGGPGFTLPPINIPGFTIPPIGLPGGGPIGEPSATPCTIVTAAQVSQIFGTQVIDSSSSPTDCTFQTALTSAVSVSTTSDTDFSGIQFLLGNTAQASTIGGFQALTGTFLGQGAVYVQTPSGQVQVLGILTGSDPETMTKLQQVAALAVGPH